MHTFALRRRSWWVARAFGRNRLLRRTDRIEACVIVSAMLLALAATPVCAAAGVAVYGSHARLYAEQAQARHTVAATVIEPSARTTRPTPTALRSERCGRLASPCAQTGSGQTVRSNPVTALIFG